MMMAAGNLAFSDPRREDREEVHHRTRAVTADGNSLPLLVVNISPHGMMARCEATVGEGDVLRVALPGLGQVRGEVRWSLGGRLGCQFDRPIALAPYYELIATLLRS